MPYKGNNLFSGKLHQLIVTISENKHMHMQDVEQELAKATGRGIWRVRDWHLRDEMPHSHILIEQLAQAIYKLDGWKNREEVEGFLRLGGHPNPEKLLIQVPTKSQIDRGVACEILEEMLPKIQKIVNIEGPEDYVNGWTAISRYDKMDELWCNIQPLLRILLDKDIVQEQRESPKRVLHAGYPLLKFAFLSPHFLQLRGKYQLRLDLATLVTVFAQAEHLDGFLAWLNADIIPWPFLVMDPTPHQLRTARSALEQACQLCLVWTAQKSNISAQANALLAQTYLLDTSMRFSERIHRADQYIQEALRFNVAFGVRANVLRSAGDLYYHQQKYDEAIQYYEDSYLVDLESTKGEYPTIVGNQVRLVEAYLAAGKIADAQTAMKRLRDKTPEFCYGPVETKWLKEAQVKLAQTEGNQEAAKQFICEAEAAAEKFNRAVLAVH